MEKENFTIVN